MRALAAACRATSHSFLLCAVVCFFGMLAASIVLYNVEKEQQPEVFSNVPACLWWAICEAVNMRGVGAYPMTVIGRFSAMAVRLLGLGMIAVPAGLLASEYRRERAKHLEEKDPKAFCPHCGKRLNSDDP
jgi:voltage-gated potassium channel